MSAAGHPTIPYAFARRHGVLLARAAEDTAELVLRPDASLSALAEVRRMLARPLQLTRVDAECFDAKLAEHYGGQDGSTAELVADIGQELDLGALMSELPAVEDLLASQDEAPVIRMINALLTQAVRDGASDVHIEPYERDSVVRFRRDGVLHDAARPHRGLHAAVVSRIKIMASLDISEKRLPQDGRIGLRLAGRQVDVRVSTLPTAHGERLVLRLLDKGAARLGLESLGMAEDTRARFEALLRQPHGIVLVTGPTGSGKSTSLYAALQGMDARRLNIVTVEDPVEFDLPGIGQTQVNPRIELDFARALRAILRQDPDVIMIGEIRDRETAEIAIQSALTGHLVLSTVHTNDALGAFTRLIDMGVEPFLVATPMKGLQAQRLVRRLCPHCARPHAVPARIEAEARVFAERVLPGVAPRWMEAVGCSQCLNTGYRGRLGIYEMVPVTERMQHLIVSGASVNDMKALAREEGCRFLRDDGLLKAWQGLTTVEEVLRVAGS